MKDQIKKDISDSKNVKSKIACAGFLLSLLVIVSLISLYRVKMQFNIGPPWDTYAFLSNGLYFAGKSIGYVELERPPFLSVLVSLIFRLGYVSESVIYYVDAAIFVFGCLGLFLLLNLRFDKLQSFFGTIFYACSPIILIWVGTGYTDVAGVSFSIWAIYLTVLATTRNSKFFYLAFPMVMIAFLTRFNMAFIILPIIFCIVATKDVLKPLKDILIGVFISLLILTPFLILYYFTYGDPFFPFTTTLGLTESLQAEKVAYVADNLYYLKNIPNFAFYYTKTLPSLAYLIFIIPLIGICLFVYKILKKNIILLKTKNKVWNAFDSSKKRNKQKYILLMVLFVGFLISFGNISYISTDILFFLICILTYNIFRNSENFLALDLTIALWLIVFLAFHSSYGVKVDRYFLTMIAPLSYFLVLGFNEITGKIVFNVKNINIINLIMYPLLILILLSSTFTYIQDIPQNSEFNGAIASNQEVYATVNWLKNHDPNYIDKNMISDLWPFFSWNLKTKVNIMPVYNNSSYFSHELEKEGSYYYFSKNSINSSYYDAVARFGNLIVYQRNSDPLTFKQSVFYIGKNWHRYIEEVLDFKVYLRFDLRDAGRYGIGKSIFIDNYSPNELQKYPYLFLYNFKWHDRNNAEKIIYEYVENGGTVVIDASGNMDGVMYNLDNTVFMNTTIIRSALPTNPTLWVSPAFSNETYKFSPFVSEDGVWFGATYSALSPNKIENIATLNGNTLIGVQKIGKGKIVWIGYNFFWHAFFYKNQQEKNIIQKALAIQ